jgi:hypothetical protein
MYRIETDTLTLNLEILPVESLFMHEEIIPRSVKKLIFEFKNLASLQNPVIVDENHVVLDGNHRAYVFKTLKFRFIPVCKIDYLDENTKLRCWFRRLGNVQHANVIVKAFQSLGCRVEPVSGKEALSETMAANSLSCGVQQNNEFACIVFPENTQGDPVAAYSMMQRVQDILTAQGISLTYVPCNSVRKDKFGDKLGTDEAVVWTPRITKSMVVDCAMQEKVFAPKTTRHVIPVRPLNVNVPGHWLKENVSLEEINQRFEAFLNKKKVRRFGPGQVIDGRYYEEELVVFYDAARGLEK